MVRRLAKFVQDDDLAGLGGLLVLMFRDEYHKTSTKEMMDTLESVRFEVDKLLCKTAEAK